jgi:prepilin-type N-terminal cleavage/methylation domain-containing protein
MGQKRGFTLIELLIVIGICGLFLAISFPSLNRFKDTVYLESSARAAAMELRKVQSLAICRNENMGCTGSRFAFARSGAAMPGGTGTEVLRARSGLTRKLVVSPAGRVRIE